MTSDLINEMLFNAVMNNTSDVQMTKIITTSNLNTKATTKNNTFMLAESKEYINGSNIEQTFYTWFVSENRERYACSVSHDIFNFIVTLNWNTIYNVDFIQNFDYYMSTLACFYDYIEFENEKYMSFIPILLMYVPEIQHAIDDASYDDLEIKITMHGGFRSKPTKITIRFDDYIYI